MYASPSILNLNDSNWFKIVLARIYQLFIPLYLGLNSILNVPYALGERVIELFSINLKWSLGVKSNFAVAGIVPSFFKIIDWVQDFPILVFGNLTISVLSSAYSFGF